VNSSDLDALQPMALIRATEVLTDVLLEAQRRLAEQAAMAAHVREPEPTTKTNPAPYVDLTPYAGMDDRDVLLALGASQSDVRYYMKALQRHRQADSLHAARGEHRC
jgi:hypothetical protein